MTPPIRVDLREVLNLIRFSILDKDYIVDNINENKASLFTVTTNDTNFFVSVDPNAPNQFSFNFRAVNGNKLNYNINNAHRYVIELTAYDSGVPQRSSKALVFVPLINCNVNPPSFTAPVILVAAITFPPNCQLGILNAWDLDGDVVSFSLDPSNKPFVMGIIDVLKNGTVLLKSSLNNVPDSFTFLVLLTDDGSSCDGQNTTRISLQTKMPVTLKIIDVNMHSPRFVPNSAGINFCEAKFQAYENSKFRIEIVAQDDDPRDPNGRIVMRSPDLTDRSPQYSFKLSTPYPQANKKLIGIVENLEEFDYENPKYGSNTLNLMFYAEDLGLPKRVGYCFMSIEILDVNDNVPVFAQRTYNIYIHEQYKTRHFTYRFVAIDKDSGRNGEVEYFMDTQEYPLAAKLFNLALDGTLTVRNASCLDELTDRLTFTIYAEDNSTTRNKSERVTVYIIKTTLKLLPPFFSDFPEPAELRNISEMVPRGSTLRSFPIVIQTDPSNQFLRCFLSPKPNPEWFKFEFQNKIQNQNLSKIETCNLKIEDPLNYRIASDMVIYMIAEVGSNTITSTARELKILTIYLKEENINPPKFVSNTIEASVVESNDDLNKVIAVVKAYDIDKTSPNNQITYSFDPYGNTVTDPEGYFSIDQNTGEIKLIKSIRNKKNIPLEVNNFDFV